MINKKNICERGGILIELLLSIAVLFSIIPFLFKFQHAQIEKKENLKIINDMELIKSGVEQYIETYKDTLINNIGKSIIRIELKDLEEFGVYIGSEYDYQIRILKLINNDTKPTFQGIVILNNKNINPLKTRQITNAVYNNFGFIENNKIYGSFNTFKVNLSDIGLYNYNGIVSITPNIRIDDKYLYRLPSNDIHNSVMKSSLNLSGNNILGASNIVAENIKINNILKTNQINSKNLTFNKLISSDKIITKEIFTNIVSSNNKNLSINNKLYLNNTGYFNKFLTNDFITNSLTLNNSNLSGKSKEMEINKTLKIDLGKIKSNNVIVNNEGSIASLIKVNNIILDYKNDYYFWDLKKEIMQVKDLELTELNKMISLLGLGFNETITYNIFNKNLQNNENKISDFIKSLNIIKKEVTNKFNKLNLI